MKNLFIVILIVLCALLTWKAFFSNDQRITKSETPIAKAGKNLVSLEVQKINRTVDEKGFNHALIDDKKHALGVDKQLDDSSKKIIDSVLVLLKIKDKQLISYTSVIASLKDSLLKGTNYGDTLWKYQDGIASISFNRPREQFSYNINPTIDYAEYWDRSWFMAPKRFYLDVWIPNENATISGVKRLRLEPKPDPFDLTLKGTSQYHMNEIGLGGKVNLRIGRFTGSGSYLYYPRFGDWKPAFSLDYEIGGL